MKILGNRILVSKVEEEKAEGFQTVEVQDSFVNKGRVELLGPVTMYTYPYLEGVPTDVEEINLGDFKLKVGDIVLFAKYSPDTQELRHEGKDMKIINIEDILAIL